MYILHAYGTHILYYQSQWYIAGTCIACLFSLTLTLPLSLSLSYTHHSQQHHIGDTPQSSSILQRDSLGNEVPVRKELHPQRPSRQEHTSVPGKDLQGMKCG